METSATYGYARVSSKDQNLDRQLDAFAQFPIEATRIYTDYASGKNFDRPGYLRLMQALRPGDTLVVSSIDRLGRNYDEILEQWRIITKQMKVYVVVLDMPLLDTRKSTGGITGVFLSDIVLQLLSYVAQVERENIKQRQLEGIAAAKQRGVRFGRPPIKRPASYSRVKYLYLYEGMSRRTAASQLGVSLGTFDRWIRQDRVAGRPSVKSS